MDRTDRTADRRVLAAGWAVLLATAATGCVAMPSGGAPQRLEVSQNAADGLQVHVYPVAPHKGETPKDLLAGFLDSSNADQANYDTAKQYLTAAAAGSWKPDAGVVVLEGAPTPKGSAPADDDTAVQLTVEGKQVAALDEQHTYKVHTAETYSETFTFVKESDGPDKGEWRISDLPNGLIVDQTNFKNTYKPVHRYFFAANDPSAARTQNAQVLVPDPIYLRRRIDPLTEAAQAAADGPSRWLGPVVASKLDGVRVESAVIGDNRVATVKLEGGDPAACKQMAQQLFQTLADQQSKLDRLDLSTAGGGCSLSSTEAALVAPGVLAGAENGVQAFIQLADGRLTRFYQEGSDPVPVPGVLGQVPQAGQFHPGTVAVRRDTDVAAVIGADGQSLVEAELADGGKYGEPIVRSHAPSADKGLASPSWDGRRNLWLVDRDPAAPRVLMVRDGVDVPVEVEVEGLDGRAVQSLRISSDGTRIALLLSRAGGPTKLALGLVRHGGTAKNPTARITGLNDSVPQLTEVAAVAWGDADQLVVLGKETDRLQQLYFLGTDGSQATDYPLQGGGTMKALSATEARLSADPTNPSNPAVLTSSDSGLYRLKDNQWYEVPGKSETKAFIYPG
ncbi:LpqB family beta-propeller domain-containing protein [Kitasatospora phosalacinea]|uniref:LpqB family beta-propeller domain-containing protein n=1 Tax=Kitasatospora phosalacinea TaxID=2065 RepID=UPI000525FA68|nr:LpqB family beta-propeller domain-containing protein [Kitasatospora phosalacinea]